VGSLGIIVLLPGVDDGSGMCKAAEPMEIQALITKLTVEALDMGILRRLAGFDEIEGDTVHIGSSIEDL
jgi:hypothetical protein